MRRNCSNENCNILFYVLQVNQRWGVKLFSLARSPANLYRHLQNRCAALVKRNAAGPKPSFCTAVSVSGTDLISPLIYSHLVLVVKTSSKAAVSSRIGMKFGTIIVQVNSLCIDLRTLAFRFDVTFSRWQPCRRLKHRNAAI